jgi:hypothetical protein
MWRNEMDHDEAAVKALGVASIGIGATELLAPHLVERMMGLDPSESTHGTLRALGVRELMHGVGILADGSPSRLAAGIWSRVAGDVLDTALLTAAAMRTHKPLSFAATTATVMAIGALDVLYAVRITKHLHC